MNKRLTASILLGAIVSFLLVAGHSQVVRSCGRPSWFDSVRGDISNVRPVAPGSGIEAPYGIVCDYFPSTLDVFINSLLLGMFFLIGGTAAGAICRRHAGLCGAAAALLGAIVVATPGFGLELRELQRVELPVLELIADTVLSVLVASLLGALGGVSIARLRPNTLREQTRER